MGKIFVGFDKETFQLAVAESGEAGYIAPHHTLNELAVRTVSREARETGKAIILQDISEWKSAVINAFEVEMNKGGIIVICTNNECPCGRYKEMYENELHVAYTCRCSSRQKRQWWSHVPDSFLSRFTIVNTK